MNPEDVPEELDGIAKEAWNRHAATAPPGTYHHEGIRRAIVAAVMPEIERRTREQVASESAVLRPADLAEILDYVAGRGDVRVVRDETLDRAFAALKATLPASGEGR